MAIAQILSGITLLLLLATNITQARVDWQCNKRYCFGTDHIVKHVFSLENADQMCKQIDRSSWLLEIYDKGVEDELNSYLATRPNLQSKPLLLNLQRKGTQWMWLDHTKYDAKQSDVRSKVKLFNNDPFTTLRYLPYRGIYGATYVTTRLQNYICSFEGSCNKHDVSGTEKTLSYKGICYASYNDKTTDFNWFEAENKCFNKGSSLAVFSHFTARELQNVFRRFVKPNENYWVGLVKHTWEWRHNTASVSNYTKWLRGYPRPNLLHLPSERVFTTFDSSNGSIWTDMSSFPASPVVCMKENYQHQKREIQIQKLVVDATETAATPTNPRFKPSRRSVVSTSFNFPTTTFKATNRIVRI